MKLFPFLKILFLALTNFRKSNCYTFSVIMAIYNTGRFLDESIGSLLNQTIGYQEIQIILVNDGSNDNTEEICLKYQKSFKNNIIYIKIEHGGVSKARNIGMKWAKGKYINFLDPDDLWDFQAFHYILLFFRLNKNINFVTGRLKFFEAINDYHPLDYKFYKTRIVNLTEEYNCIQSSSSTSFFRFSYINGKRFPEGVPSGEDTRFVNLILLNNPLMGVVREAVYFCRKRYDLTSRTQIQKKDMNFYFSTIFEVSQYLINNSLVLYKKILPFIQFYIGYDLLFRIESLSYQFLNTTNYKNYCYLIDDLLQKVEDKYILEQKNVLDKFKILALSRKYKKDLRNDIILKNGTLHFFYFPLINLNIARNIIIWKIISIENDILHIEGIDNLWFPKEKYYFFCKFGNRIFYEKYELYFNQNFNSLYGVIEKGRTIYFDIPLENIKNETVHFYINYMNDYCEIFPTPGSFTHISTIPESYYISNNYIIKIVEKRLTVFKYSERLENDFEKLYCIELKRREKNKIIKLRRQSKKYQKKFDNVRNQKEIWIINDRRNRAGDNGEYFFRYLSKRNPKTIKAYFTIQKNSSDYQRLKKYGDVLDIDSYDYLKIFLRANKILSSISNYWVNNPFGDDHKYIKDLFHFDFIFLSNGIIKDNLSKYLNRINSNIDIFVASTKSEYKSLLSTDYGYKKNNIILTGLPRYDNLEKYKKINNHEDSKIILVIPTWRMNIKGKKDSLIYETIYSDSFKSSAFFQFYNNLINDIRLTYTMNLYNYTGIFCLHQQFTSQWIDFSKNKQFKITKNCNYQQLIIKGSLLVTDYSSIFFDFGYLKKPIIYTHFDYEEYRLNQYPEGYFDYKKDGFGPIFENYNSTVNGIIESIKSHCKMKNKYLRRIKKFFTFFDEHNSDRIYKELLKRKNMKEDDTLKKRIFILFGFISLISFKIMKKLI